ncbi:MAG: hypothetical protein EU539_04105 [Promethearchaeota archaeon]|nr:MAG: hypothetical protein EU539_04105 [Candidatus Lokiarchaeota archaeon]
MPKKPSILFDLSHSEMLDIREKEFSEFLALLRSLDLRIKINENKNITGKILENIDILIIGNPIDNYFSSIEIKSIIDFVREGGNLLLISEYGSDYLQKTNLNDISGKYFGIYFQKNIVKTKKSSNENCSSILRIHEFHDNSITNQIREIVLAGSCSFLINKNSEPLFTTNSSWTEIYDDSIKKWLREEDEDTRLILGAYTEFGRGKIAALGDIDLFTNDFNIGLNCMDNRTFIKNLLDWFLEPMKNEDVIAWILDQLGVFQAELKNMNNKINNIIETTSILEKRISSLEDNNQRKEKK